ncbi:hypothetical protein ACIQ9E_03505 [Streptomyces sp. NPDC094448]|uniref:hypothetical protein n=1 Tax=Streptomyces sp. NPDC094448 TaxID=3366063 RepID=UPI00381DAFC1
MTTRRRILGSGPESHRSPEPDEHDAASAPTRIQATDADLDAGLLYWPDIPSLDDLRVRGVLGRGLPPSHGTADAGRALRRR